MQGEPVQRIRRGEEIGKDRYNVPVYGPDSTETIEGAAFDPGGSSEPVEVGRASVVTSPTLYWTREVDTRADDRWVVRGVTYETEGRPGVWVNPWSGATAGTVVSLRAVEG